MNIENRILRSERMTEKELEKLISKNQDLDQVSLEPILIAFEEENEPSMPILVLGPKGMGKTFETRKSALKAQHSHGLKSTFLKFTDKGWVNIDTQEIVTDLVRAWQETDLLFLDDVHYWAENGTREMHEHYSHEILRLLQETTEKEYKKGLVMISEEPLWAYRDSMPPIFGEIVDFIAKNPLVTQEVTQVSPQHLENIFLAYDDQGDIAHPHHNHDWEGIIIAREVAVTPRRVLLLAQKVAEIVGLPNATLRHEDIDKAALILLRQAERQEKDKKKKENMSKQIRYFSEMPTIGMTSKWSDSLYSVHYHHRFRAGRRIADSFSRDYYKIVDTSPYISHYMVEIVTISDEKYLKKEMECRRICIAKIFDTVFDPVIYPGTKMRLPRLQQKSKKSNTR